MRKKPIKIGLSVLLSLLIILSNPSVVVLAQEISQAPSLSPTTNDQTPTTTATPSPTITLAVPSSVTPSPNPTEVGSGQAIDTPSLTPTQSLIINHQSSVTPSPSPTLSPAEVTTKAGTRRLIVAPTFAPSQMPSASPIPTLTLEQNQPESAQLRRKLALLGFEKAHYQAREKVRVMLQNDYGRPLDIAVRNSEGIEIPVVVQRDSAGDQSVLTISPYGYASFRPGKYKLKITDESGHTQTQDFTWGVLAINTNKSIFLPGDSAQLAMAVLDDKGSMVCDAFVRLEITTPNGETTTLTTQEGTITVNKECSSRALTYTPDYSARYAIGSSPGKYQLTLSADTRNGTRSITDAFEVRSSVPFDVERKTATRIFPIHTYDVDLAIVANQDFEGKVTETVPENFAISPPSEGSLAYDEVATKSAILANATVTGTYKTPVLLPFQGDFKRTLGFSETPDNPALAQHYRRFGLSSHDGVDFAMPMGTPLLAIDEGKVLVAGWEDYGITVVLEHSWGESFYGHLSRTDLLVGQSVSSRQEIGLSGSTGLSTGPHLHFSLEPKNPDKDNGYKGKIDPLTFLAATSQSNPTLLSYQELSWNLSLKKGDSVRLGYRFDAPDVSPQFYLLGPLEFKTPSADSLIPSPTINISPTTSQSIQSNQTISESIGSAIITPFATGQATSYTTIFQEARRWQVAADVTTTIEQQINIISQEFSTTSSTYVPTDNSLGLVRWDSAKYAGDTVYFEVVLRRSGGLEIVGASLYSSGGTQVTGSEVTTSSGTYVRLRSAALTLGTLPNLESGVDYTVRIFGDDITPTSAFIKAARLIVVQTDDTRISDTQTQVEVGNNEALTNTSDTQLSNKKIYRFTSSVWTPSPTVYFEATLSNDTAGSTAFASLYTNGSTCTSQVASSEVSVTGTTWTRVRSAAITLTNATDYMVCIRAGANTARIANAKIILEQTAKEGITALETVQHYLNTLATDADSTYTNKDYLNQYDPANFAGGTFTKFFESTLKTAAGTGFTQLRNDTDASAITGSEVSTTSTTYVRLRSGDITANLPSTAKRMDTQLRNSATNITSGASSWLIIQASALPTVPTTDQQLKHGDWFSTGGVRQSFTF